MKDVLAALSAHFPNYTFTVTSKRSGRRQYEAVAKDDTQLWWCLIATNPAEIWNELRAAHPDA
jgi:hypothetical protein